MLHRDAIEARLRSALRAGISEVKKDPDFLIRMVIAVSEELGMDKMSAMYLASRLRARFHA